MITKINVDYSHVTNVNVYCFSDCFCKQAVHSGFFVNISHTSMRVHITYPCMIYYLIMLDTKHNKSTHTLPTPHYLLKIIMYYYNNVYSCMFICIINIMYVYMLVCIIIYMIILTFIFV